MGRRRNEDKIPECSDWFDIPGYGGRYQANDEGQIRSLCYKEPRILKQRFNSRIGSMVVFLFKGGTRTGRPIQVSKVIMDTFYGEMPKGMCRIHKNGDLFDNRPCNLAYATFKEAGRSAGGKQNRRPVAKVNFKGEIVESYKSIADAARKTGMSTQSIGDRCRFKIQNNLDNKGCTFMYMETLFDIKGDSMEW